MHVGPGLNDNEWHRVVVVVDELSLRLTASVDNIYNNKSVMLRRCAAVPLQTDHADDTPRPLLISLAGS